MKKGNRAHSISDQPVAAQERITSQTPGSKKKRAQPTLEIHDWQQSSPLSVTDSFRFSSFWPCAFVVLLVCFVSLGVVLVSALSGLLDSDRSGCPLLAGDDWSFSFLFRFWLCCRGFLWPCVCCLLLFPLVAWSCFVVCVQGWLRVACSLLAPLSLLCPPFSPLVHAGPVSVLLVPPSGCWLYWRRSGCHVLHCVL